MLLSLRGLKSIYFFLSCAMSISFPDSLLFGELRMGQETWGIFPQPFLFLAGQRRCQVMKMKMRSNHSSLKYLLTWNLLCLISAVSSLTKTDDKTTSETPDVVQSIQGLWFCHADYQPRFLSLQRKSQGKEVDLRTFSSSVQCNSPINILWLGPFQFQQEVDADSGCEHLLWKHRS